MLTMTSVARARVRGECCGVVVVWCVWRGGGGGGKVACSLPRLVVAQWLIKAVGRSADPVLGPWWRPRGDSGHGASLFISFRLFFSVFSSFLSLLLFYSFECMRCWHPSSALPRHYPPRDRSTGRWARALQVLDPNTTSLCALHD